MGPPSGLAPESSPRASSDEEKAKDRLITWRSALLSAGVVIAAGLVGAMSSYVVASRQIDSEAEQAQADFLRSQRQTVYAQFLGDVLQIDTALDLASPANDGDPPEFDPASATALRAALADVHADLGGIVLVSSTETADVAQVLADELELATENMLRDYCVSARQAQEEVLSVCERLPAVTEGDEPPTDDDLTTDLNAVVLAMREELGV